MQKKVKSKRKIKNKLKNAFLGVNELSKNLISLKRTMYLKFYTELSPLAHIRRYVPLNRITKFVMRQRSISFKKALRRPFFAGMPKMTPIHAKGKYLIWYAIPRNRR